MTAQFMFFIPLLHYISEGNVLFYFATYIYLLLILLSKHMISSLNIIH